MPPIVGGALSLGVSVVVFDGFRFGGVGSCGWIGLAGLLVLYLWGGFSFPVLRSTF